MEISDEFSRKIRPICRKIVPETAQPMRHTRSTSICVHFSEWKNLDDSCRKIRRLPQN
jgi:hypothetical protein